MKLPSLQIASEEMLHLDFLRFVAAVGIVFHHSVQYFLPHPERSHLPTFALALFVDLFFAISGFVIAYVYHDRVSTPAGYGRFLQRRVGRLVPLHWLTLSIWFVLWATVAMAGIHAEHFPSLSAKCIADTAFLLHGVIPCGNGDYLNGVTWSISAEMMMYLSFPLVAEIARRWRPSLPMLAAISGAIALFYSPSGIYTDLPPLIRAVPAFLFGASLFFYRKEIATFQIPYAAFPIAVCTLAVSMVTAVSQLIVVPQVFLVAFLAMVFDSQGAVPSVIRRGAPLGQLTYSIYMWHLLFVLVLMNMIGDKLLHGRYEIPLALLTYTSIAIMSYVSYFFIETPARRWFDRLLFRRVSEIT